MRSGAALLVIFEVIYFIFDRYISPPLTPATTALHAGAVGLTVLVLALTTSKRFERKWQPICLANLLAIYGVTLALRLLNGETEPLFITVALSLVGTGALLPWSNRWQAGLSAAALATMGMLALVPAPADSQVGYQCVGVLTAAILGHFILLMRHGYQAELAGWMSSLRDSHQDLADALARSAAVMAERELAERRLRNSEAKLRKVFEASCDAITINRLSDGRYLDRNQGFCDETGYTREETLGRTPGEMGLWADLEQLRSFLRLLKAEGRVRNLECTFRAKNGRLAQHLMSASVMELDGEACVVSIMRNIGELKQTQRELAEAREALSAEVRELEASQRHLRNREADLHKVFEASVDAIAISRIPDARLLDCNLEFLRITGLSREETRALTIPEMAIWARVEQYRDFVRQLKEHGFVRGMEIDLRRRDGVVMPFLLSAVKTEIDGQPCVVTVTRDISQLKRTECELVAAREAALAGSEAKSEFLSVMSHEIRTPMNAILGMADLLWETPLGAEQRRYLDTMRRNGNSLLSLINGILDLAKVESGRLSLERVGFNLVELCEDVIETLGVRAHEKGLELALRIRPGVSTALIGDPLRLRQILINLLGNAIKFTKHGEVTLTVEAAAPAQLSEFLVPPPGTEAACGPLDADTPQTRQLLRFVVRDTGVGIAADKLEAIFSNFTQADSTIGRKYGGSGLGLAIVKRLVELMNGQIEADSRLGEGTTLSFVVPLDIQPGAATGSPACAAAADGHAYRNGGAATGAADAAAVPPGAARPRAVARGATAMVTRPLRILLAEDSPDNRLLIEVYLKSTPYRLDYAEDGEAAVRKFMTAQYDAILMDLQMPVMDGYEAVAEIRRLEQTGHRRRTPIIVLTASADDEAARMSFKMGCDAHVTKPVKRSTLLEAIRDAVEPAAQAAPSSIGNGGSADPAAKVPQEPLVVQLDQDLRDLVPGFLARKREDACAILAAAEHGESEAIARLGHNMRGEGGSYGLDTISEIGRELEQAGKVSDLDAARRLARNLISFLDRIEIVYHPTED